MAPGVRGGGAKASCCRESTRYGTAETVPCCSKESTLSDLAKRPREATTDRRCGREHKLPEWSITSMALAEIESHAKNSGLEVEDQSGRLPKKWIKKTSSTGMLPSSGGKQAPGTGAIYGRPALYRTCIAVNTLRRSAPTHGRRVGDLNLSFARLHALTMLASSSNYHLR